MDDFTPINYTIGDLVTHGTVVWDDNEDRTIFITRDGDQMIIRTMWKNVRAVLERNMREAADFNATGRHGEMVHIGRVPLGIHEQWEREGILQDDKALSRRLNDSDFAKLRTNSWRV